MSVTIYGTSSSEKAYVSHNGMELYYSINVLNQVSRIVKFEVNSLQTLATYSLEETSDAVVFWIRDSINKNVQSVQKIATCLGWEVVGEGLDCLLNFENVIEANKRMLGENLDLSGIELNNIPPQIKLFTEIKKLNLSNNQIRMLPVELQYLDQLEEIDLTKNPIVELPLWVSNMKKLVVTFDKLDIPSGSSCPLAQEEITSLSDSGEN